MGSPLSAFVMLLALLFYLVPSVSSLCSPNLLSTCDNCCSMLFNSEDCEIAEIFRVRINGNGALGAIWDNAVTAVMVKPGCLLDMWDVRNQTGKHRAFGLDGKVYFDLQWYAFEKKASSLRCSCTTTPPPTTTTEDPISEYVDEGEEATEDFFIEKTVKGEENGIINITDHLNSTFT